ncbi:MarR family winged helix-turn-helix transcriptional regulator [Faecalispora anaeroviscerum]|uniref:MarR family winged helix-turn-helix transcriptional regulator n=1 Tax=Faecalispora anaeroviscerum TaxID=2991836 RepID=UPI0024BA2FCC|nr:MarR family transcriptional regulator [Faecalispora anaeroviscerum]
MKNEDHDKTSALPAEEVLKLENQLCFALYVSSKEIIRRYKPLLEPLHLTYTGYITMMALWEKDDISVKELGKRLTLDSGTLTPLLKKLELLSYIERIRSNDDDRSVRIRLTEAGRTLKADAAAIPEKMICSAGLEPEKLGPLLKSLHGFIGDLTAEP